MNFKSKLSDHVIKKGKVITPLNHAMGDTLSFNSWAKERLPEYIWLALIHSYYGRSDAFAICFKILQEFRINNIDLERPKFSTIFNLDNTKKLKAFEIISEIIDVEVLSPLTLLYRRREYPEFNDFFYIEDMLVEEKIERLNHIMKTYSEHQSNDATDLRYIVISNLFINGKIVCSSDLKHTPDAIRHYPEHDHDDEIMRMFRPSIRSLEGLDIENTNQHFISNFKKELAMITQCNPVYIDFGATKIGNEELINDISNALALNVSLNKEILISDNKYEVMVGSMYYSLKIFKEISEIDHGSSILGRHGIRTIVEVYIMMKYLLVKESNDQEIWGKYKLYGISKYKMILLKNREFESDIKHFVGPIAEAIVNEIQSEEFTDIDLTYFDKQGIREKSIIVDEKLLYDVYYDYDTNYAHGLWGAVRESVMLICDNPTHYYHCVPDTNFNQTLPSVIYDCEFIFFKLLTIFNQQYKLPDWFIEKYKEKFNENS
ncbi:DUF5677 domain-containing protein [Bacillus sp. AFS017336]|uniref:DUF5677 domain-containing protein n=1 Tax=Bacillus sp. AFS017336 TaxID=2033489 RepID=UPI000BF1DB83|nr:DUF5677 domain-containing protein [Bacillus sp. AFS017336]PEL13030.1 hypothetical protein CN601_05955 [Bacillus sp. AFS017336]